MKTYGIYANSLAQKTVEALECLYLVGNVLNQFLKTDKPKGAREKRIGCVVSCFLI